MYHAYLHAFLTSTLDDVHIMADIPPGKELPCAHRIGDRGSSYICKNGISLPLELEPCLCGHPVRGLKKQKGKVVVDVRHNQERNKYRKGNKLQNIESRIKH
jgi:hypothetical protein